MTTTAHDDQFTDAPESVRQPYDAGSILRRNVADLEIALKQQAERAEAAEAELARLWGQEPVAWKYKDEPWFDGNHWHDSYAVTLSYATAIFKHKDAVPLYAAPVPAPAVPDDWREVMAELAADLQASIEAEHAYRDQYSSVMRKYQNDMRIVERARALLQAIEVTK